MTSMVTITKEDSRDKVHQKKEDCTTTCIPLRHLLGDFMSYILSHMVAEQQLHRYSHYRRKGKQQKGSTSGEETTMSSSPHVGLQCSDNIGALQQHDHNYDHMCTSCDDIKKSGDILATCLRLYDVDIKDGA